MKKISKILGLLIFLLCFSCLISSASAFSVGTISIDPSGSLVPGTPVTVSYKVDAAGFPSGDDLQFFTELENPKWTYTISANGIDNLCPSTGGKTLTITGFELAYKSGDTVEVRATLEGKAPTVTQTANKTIICIQEVSAQGLPITSTVVTRMAQVGVYVPPTGSISVSSTPSGADVFLDNAYKGLTTLPMSGITNGDHVVIVRLTGYQDWTQNVTVFANSTSLSATLVAIANTTPTTTTITPTPTPTLNSTANGSIYIQSSPISSKVFLNNVFQGYTPMTLYNLTASSTPLVTVRSAGYNEWSQNVAVTAGGTTTVTASLVLAPEETTATTTVPTTTVTTVKTTAKSTAKIPTPWPSATPTPAASPVSIIAILGAVGVGFIVIRKW